MKLSNRITFIDQVDQIGCQLVKYVKVLHTDTQKIIEHRIRVSYDGINYWFMSDNHAAKSFKQEPSLLDMIDFADFAYNR